MKLSELLTEETWIKAKNAININGLRCNASSEEAVCWCLQGAIHRLGRLPLLYNVERALKELYPEFYRPGIVCFNDHEATTWPMVKALIERAESYDT